MGMSGNDHVWQINLIHVLAKQAWQIGVKSNCYVMCMILVW